MLPLPAFPEPSRLWRPRRLVAVALAMLLTTFVVVFAADAGELRGHIFSDAITNTVAAALAAVLVWRLCVRIPWQLGDRWWFLPAHVVGALVFTLLWYWSIAVAIAISSVLAGGPWTLVFLSGPALHWQGFTAVVLYVAVAAGCYAIQASHAAHDALALHHAAETAALRAQLDPHLLFNTLHSLLELVRSGDQRADAAIDRFARVARYVSDGRRGADDSVALAEEWAMVRDYVALESLRLGPRLTCAFEWAPGLEDARIPALSLQPLVENAIRHGIAPRAGPGTLALSARAEGGRLHLRVDDDGLGASAAAATRGSGAGLDLVRRRLAARFGDTLHFSAAPRHDGSGWRVDVSFPISARA